MDDYILMHPDREYLKKCLKEIESILLNEYKLKLNKKKTMVTNSKEGFVFLGYHYKIIGNKTVVRLRSDTIRKVKKTCKKNKTLFENVNITFERRFGSINNYKYTFMYNRKKLYNIIDKYN